MVDDITGPLRRRYPAHLHDELEPVGRHGLVLAALAFEDTGAVAFASYGWKRIANYIRAELRKRSFGASDLAPEHMDPEGGDGADSCPVEDGYLDSMHAAVTGEASRLATRSPEEGLAELRERERTSTILRQTRARLDKARAKGRAAAPRLGPRVEEDRGHPRRFAGDGAARLRGPRCGASGGRCARLG